MRSPVFNRILFFALFVLLFLPTLSYAVDRFASPSGGGDCSIGSPCSVQTCIEATTAGNRCYLRAGTYNVSIRTSIMTIHSGTDDSNRVFIGGYPGDPPLSVILRPTSGSPIAVEWNQSTAYVTFENMVLDAEVADADALHSQGPNTHHIRWKDLEVRNAMAMGPSCGLGGPEVCPGKNGIDGHSEGNGGHHQEFLNLKVHHNGFNRLSHNMYMVCNDCIVDGGEYHDTNGYNLQIYNSACGGTGCDHRFIVRNAKIYDGRGDGAMTVNYGNDILVYNNLIYNNGNSGIDSCYGNTNNLQIYNNVFYGNGGVAVSLCAGGVTNTQVKNNIFMNNSGAVGGAGATTNGTTYAKNLCFNTGGNTTDCTDTGNPLFTNPGSAVFTLESGSPAIGAGVTLANVPTDFAGNARTIPYDIGAYETGGGPPPPTPLATPFNMRITVAP